MILDNSCVDASATHLSKASGPLILTMRQNEPNNSESFGASINTFSLGFLFKCSFETSVKNSQSKLNAIIFVQLICH
jgi:hypothetical protein